MTHRKTRLLSPRLWSGLALAGVAAQAAAAGAVHPGAPDPAPALWRVSGEGGESGEGGAPITASAEAALLIELAKLEAHLVAVEALYDGGAVDDAAALASHPEAEFMEDLRTKLASAHMTDRITPATDALVEMLYDTRPAAEVRAGIAAAIAAIRAAESAAPGGPKPRFDAITQLARDAAAGLAYGVAGGKIADRVAAEEARGFLTAARCLAEPLAGTSAADTVLAEIAAADAQTFGTGVTEGAPADTTVLFGAAARIEFAGLTVKSR